MSAKGIELDFPIQGMDRQKFMMQTRELNIPFSAARFNALAAGKAVNGETVEAVAQTNMTKKGRLSRVIVDIRSNTLNVVTALTLKKNGSDASPLLQFFIGAASTVNQESGVIVEFEEKDLLGWFFTNGAGAGAMDLKIACQLEFDA